MKNPASKGASTCFRFEWKTKKKNWPKLLFETERERNKKLFVTKKEICLNARNQQTLSFPLQFNISESKTKKKATRAMSSLSYLRYQKIEWKKRKKNRFGICQNKQCVVSFIPARQIRWNIFIRVSGINTYRGCQSLKKNVKSLALYANTWTLLNISSTPGYEHVYCINRMSCCCHIEIEQTRWGIIDFPIPQQAFFPQHYYLLAILRMAPIANEQFHDN